MVKYICFLRDSNAAEKIAALNEKDAGLAQKIKQFISNLLKRLRELMSGMKPDSFEGQLVSEMTASIEQLHKLWTNALADAGEAYSTLADNNASENNGIRYMDRDGYDVNVKIKEGVAADKNATFLRAKKNAGQAVRSTKPSNNALYYKNTALSSGNDKNPPPL